MGAKMSVDHIRAAFDAAEAVPLADGPPPDCGPPDRAGAEDCGGRFDDIPPAAPAEDSPEARGGLFPLNDYGNGQRLVEYFGQDMLFVPRLGWFRWDGRRWHPDEDELDVRRDAQGVAARILDEVPHLALDAWLREALDLWQIKRADWRGLDDIPAANRSPDQAAQFAALAPIKAAGEDAQEILRKAAAAHRAHAKTSGNTNRISNMLAEAKTAVATSVGALNADPLMLGCENGVLRFVQRVDPHAASWGDMAEVWQVDFVPHDRAQLISKMVAAEYDPAAACPVFFAFLEAVQPDPEIRDFLQRWFGYCVTGLTVEQKLAFFHGGGRNGKSTLVDALARIVADYGTTIPIETLTGSEQRKGSDATPDLVRLPGARFVRASEPEQGQRMKEALIKALTGGEAIMIRRMQQEFVEITPEFKLTISGNHKPEIRGADDGIWRRVMLVPWDVQIPEAEVDRGLPGKLWAERAGILAWMVRGCLDYLQGGLRPPAAVIEATAEYRNESDPVRVFLTTECEINGLPEFFETGRDLVDAFNAWMLETKETTWGKRTAANAIRARAGVAKGQAGEVFGPAKRSDTGYLGIRITDAARNRIAQYGEELRAAAARKG